MGALISRSRAEPHPEPGLSAPGAAQTALPPSALTSRHEVSASPARAPGKHARTSLREATLVPFADPPRGLRLARAGGRHLPLPRSKTTSFQLCPRTRGQYWGITPPMGDLAPQKWRKEMH
ncbi:hypothetical protein KIL84_020831 [Mauremys mutica]|uniref:Uncharacterized protein n=1 Tax=Mauremys mutica TaxID=74926 RepID=A0A9D4ATV9_9SAUR|nr:hypothetical protein KIL84_020831 [Mauremys mutica]